MYVQKGKGERDSSEISTQGIELWQDDTQDHYTKQPYPDLDEVWSSGGDLLPKFSTSTALKKPTCGQGFWVSALKKAHFETREPSNSGLKKSNYWTSKKVKLLDNHWRSFRLPIIPQLCPTRMHLARRIQCQTPTRENGSRVHARGQPPGEIGPLFEQIRKKFPTMGWWQDYNMSKWWCPWLHVSLMIDNISRAFLAQAFRVVEPDAV